MRLFKSYRVCALVLPVVLAAMLTSCLNNDDENDYTEWRQENLQYLADTESNPDYERVVPAWAPGLHVFMKWHNDRNLTKSNLVPLDNSTCDLKYEFRLINEVMVDSSYNQTTYGDSIYRTKPSATIDGFWTALTNMHVGDSVTVVIPYEAGYGTVETGKIPPYSTLIYHVKLVDIPAWETPIPQ